MNCSGPPDCVCGCCSGISVQTPQLEKNLPGLPVVTYRAGTWATFKASMLARLSSAEYPALAALKTRDDDDFSIALLDATSVVLDILTFALLTAPLRAQLRIPVRPRHESGIVLVANARIVQTLGIEGARLRARGA